MILEAYGPAFYTSMTWLPDYGCSLAFQRLNLDYWPPSSPLISLPFSLTIPSLTTRLSDRNRHLMLTIVVGAGILGVAMLFNPDQQLLLLVDNRCPNWVPLVRSSLTPSWSLSPWNPAHTWKTAQRFWSCPNRRATSLQPLGPSSSATTSLFHSWTPAVVLLLILTPYHGICSLSGRKIDKIL